MASTNDRTTRSTDKLERSSSAPGLKIRVSRKAAAGILNAWIVTAISATIATVVLVIFFAVTVQDMNRKLGEFRAVIERIGYQ